MALSSFSCSTDESRGEVAAPALTETALPEAVPELISLERSIGYQFVPQVTGEVVAARAAFSLSASLKPNAPVMLQLHNLHQNTDDVGKAFAHLTGDLPVDRGPDELTELRPPSGRAPIVEAGQTYWLIADSPTGAEFEWHPGDEPTLKLERLLYTGERFYSQGVAGRFELEISPLQAVAAEQAATASGL